LSVDAFDKGVVQRFLSGPHVLPPFSQASDLRSAVALTDWQLTEAGFADLEARAAAVLQTHKPAASRTHDCRKSNFHSIR
jgi:hypothetical protein